jgi:hypothetical protein
MRSLIYFIAIYPSDFSPKKNWGEKEEMKWKRNERKKINLMALDKERVSERERNENAILFPL